MKPPFFLLDSMALLCALLFAFVGEVAFGQLFPQEPAIVLEGHGGITSVAFSPDRKWLAVSGWDETIHLWDMETLTRAARMKGHKGAVMGLTFSGDSQFLASGGGDAIRLWEVLAQKLVATLQPEVGVFSVAFSPDSKWIASAGNSGLRLWSSETHKQLALLKAHAATVHAVAFSPDGRTMASGSVDQTIRIWDVSDPRQGIVEKGILFSGVVFSLAFSPGSTWLAAGNSDAGRENVRLWDIESYKEVARFPIEGGWIRSVAFSPDFKWMAAAQDNLFDGRNVWLWNIRNRKEVAVLPHPHKNEWLWEGGNAFGADSVAFSPDSKWLASGGGRDVRLWKLDSFAFPVDSKGKLPTTWGEVKQNTPNR